MDGIFIIRSAVSPSQLVPGLIVKDGAVEVSRLMETSIPGIFAAGDCAGKPYQLAKAAGEGQTAALTAVSYLSKKKRTS